MKNVTLCICILAFLYLAYLAGEAFLARRDRKKLKHVIYVNGTRGKSTVTRLIAAGLKAGGYQVLCKTTGTLPIVIHPDGREEEIVRRAPANIKEQLHILHLAAKDGAEILVIECMALQPEYQLVSSRDMLRPDIGVLTNARPDHADVMGETKEEVLNVLMEMLPANGQIFTAEPELQEQIREKAAALHSTVCFADPTQIEGKAYAEYGGFAENTALAAAVCLALGVSDEQLAVGFAAFSPDPYALAVYENGPLTFVNALSANDRTSCRQIYEQTRSEDEELIVLINHREDRPARALDMIKLCEELQPQAIWLLGEQLTVLKRYLKKDCPVSEIRIFRSAEEIPLTAEKKTLLFAVGNIKNEGIALSERAEKELLRKGERGDVQ